MHRLTCVFLGLALTWLSLAPARAQPPLSDLAAQKLVVVLRFAPTGPFTPYFRNQVRTEVAFQLRSILAPLIPVEVVVLDPAEAKRWPKRWQEFDQQGFAIFDNYQQVEAQKTHFVQLDFRQGRYHLGTRQHDGQTGFNTPMVRQAQTPERAQVSRILALLLLKDFGLVGTPQFPIQDPNRVRIDLSGKVQNLPEGLRPKRGEVFALVEMRRPVRKRSTFDVLGGVQARDQAAPTIGEAVPFVVLQVVEEADNGHCLAKLYPKVKLRRGGRVAGYQCVKLGTGTEQLQVQLVDRSTQRPVIDPIVRLRLREHSFTGPDSPRDEAERESDRFVSTHPYTHLAFASVQVGDRPRLQLPIPVLGDRLVQIPFTLEEGEEERLRNRRAYRDLYREIVDARVWQTQIFVDLEALETKLKDNSRAEQFGQREFKALTREAQRLRGKLDQLDRTIPRQAAANYRDVSRQQLESLHKKIQELGDHLEALKKVIKQEAAVDISDRDKRLNRKLQEAKLQWEQAEYDQVIKIYDEILGEAPQKSVQAMREQLVADWKITDPEHGDARALIYQQLPKVDSLEGLQALLPKLKKAVAKCKAVGDRLTLRKFDLVAVKLAQPLAEQLDQPSDPQKGEQFQKTLTEFSELLGEVTQFIASDKETPKGEAQLPDEE